MLKKEGNKWVVKEKCIIEIYKNVETQKKEIYF